MSSATSRRSLERFGDISFDDPASQAFHDRGLAHARVANQDRIILPPSRQDLNHPPNLLFSADDWVEPFLTRKFSQIDSVLFEALERRFWIRGAHGLATAQVFQRSLDSFFIDAGILQGAFAAVIGPAASDEQMLDTDILVAHLPSQRIGYRQDLAASSAQDRVPRAGAAYLWQPVYGCLKLGHHRIRRRFETTQDGRSQPVLLLQQRKQDMGRLNRLMVFTQCNGMGLAQRGPTTIC